MMNSDLIKIVHTSNLPKNFRFQRWEGQVIFNAINKDGSLRSEYVIQLLVAPDEISDYDLKKSDVIAHKSIVIDQRDILDKKPEEFVRLIQSKLQSAIQELQEQIK